MTPDDPILALAKTKEGKDPYLLLAAYEIVCHAGERLQAAQVKEMPESVEIVGITRDWLREARGEKTLARLASLDGRGLEEDEVSESAWSHYLACTHLVSMLHEHLEEKEGLAHRLAWAAEHARRAAAYASGGMLESEAFRAVQQQEADWQYARLETLCSLFASKDSGVRLRNSLLSI
jgi:hypothetical protein